MDTGIPYIVTYNRINHDGYCIWQMNHQQWEDDHPVGNRIHAFTMEPNMVWRRALPKIQQTVVRPKRNIARHIEETKTQIKDSNDSWSS